MRAFVFELYIGGRLVKTATFEREDVVAATYTAMWFLRSEADTFYDVVRFYHLNKYQLHTTVYRCERDIVITDTIDH